MTFPTYSMRQLLEAGVHFGHTTRRWNPKMAPYLFGVRNGIHIIDLEQTVPLLHQALLTVRDIVAGGGRVLFVGTKRQASERIAEAAKRCGQYYVNHRWLGGMLTNWKTISNSIKRLKEVEVRLAEEHSGLTKKELLNLTRERDKLERALGGIREMGGLPDVIFVIDTVKEHIAINEAGNLNIPVVGILDSNSDPSGVTYPVPGNDDATRAITLYCDLLSEAVLDGIQQELIASGGDIGEAAEIPGEKVPGEEEAATEAAQPEAEAEQPKTEEAPKAGDKAEAEADQPKAEEKAEEAETAKAEDAPKPEKAAEEKAAEPATEAASAEEAKPAEEPQAEDAEAKAQA